MRKALGIVFYVLAGFFVYTVCLLSFLNDEHAMAKWMMVAVFSLPAVAFLFIGLSLNRYLKWKRDVGAVLLWGTGFTVSVIFMFICFLTSEDFRKMIKPETLHIFNSYATGSMFTLSLVGLAIMLLKHGTKSAGQSHAEATSENSPTEA